MRLGGQRILLAVALVATVAGLLLPAARMKAIVDGVASDGSADFFTLDLLRGVRASLLLALPCAAALPWLGRVARRPQVEPNASRLRGYALHATLLVLALVGSGLARIATGPPLTTDAKFYLTTGIEIAEAGGVTALPVRCFSGEYREDNRHPLYPAALATFAERSDRFTDGARLLSLAGAVAAMALLLACCRQRWGDGPSLLVGVLLLTNGTFLEQAASVACETWQMAAALLWLHFATRERATWRSWAFAGGSIGLAYLLKGTGTLFVIATVITLLASHRRRALRPIGAFLAGFTVVALPLLWRNTRVFGTPFWNINSSRVFWLDDWRSFYDPQAMAQAGPGHYLATHSLVDIAVRLFEGAIKEACHLLEILSPLQPSAALGLPLLVLIGTASWTDSDRPRRWLLTASFALFFVGFSWYAKVVQGWRFLAVLVPLSLVPVAGLLARTQLVAARPRALRLLVTTIPIAILATAVSGGALSYRLDRFRPAPEIEAVQAFLLEHVGRDAGVHYLLGPSDGLTVDWDNRVRGERHRFPRTAAELGQLMDLPWGRSVRYAIVEPPTGARADRVCAAWVRDDPERGLVPTSPPPGWTRIASIPEDRPRVLVFEHR